MEGGIPPFLTVEEAGSLLRIGRTKAYDLTREWRATGGRSGLPVIDLGDVLRVPGPAIEEMLGIGRGAPAPQAPATRRPGRTASGEDGSARPQAAPTEATSRDRAAKELGSVPLPQRSRRRTRRQATRPTDQLPLFCATEPTDPDPEPPLPNPTIDPATTPHLRPTP